ncbi:hypothetical protein HPB50_029465 [Hyalomma asiaticum]|nr:hypothetical protein HPB50_029465 [Hyalomma asiaticum]
MAAEGSGQECEMSARRQLECVKDNESSTPDTEVLRANITTEHEACRWVEEYGMSTNTSWVVNFAKPTARCER